MSDAHDNDKDIAIRYDLTNGCPWLIVSAFGRELKKLGLPNKRNFTPFNETEMYDHNCIYLTHKWFIGQIPMIGKGYAFSNADPIDTKLFYRIPEQWDEALAAVKEFIK